MKTFITQIVASNVLNVLKSFLDSSNDYVNPITKIKKKKTVNYTLMDFACIKIHYFGLINFFIVDQKL